MSDPSVITATPDNTAVSSATFPSNQSLYVGDLAPDVNEGILFEVFKEIGNVSSIRVCRDAITKRSLGYAYVNYVNPQDAQTAMNDLNNTPIKGKPCRIMFSQRDPSLRKSGKGNIFIKNLHKDIDTKTLSDTFSQFGAILSCKVETNEQGESKGYGYIQYSSQESADEAIEKVNGMMLNEQQVFVGPFVSRKERIASNSEKTFTNVYVKNLDKSVDEKELTEIFSKFGEILNAVIMKDEKNESKGFGFVNFSNPEDARKAVEALNEKEIKGKQIYVGRAQKKNERQQELRLKFEQLKAEQANKYQGVNLYVKNLEDNIDDQKLRALFEPYGSITSARVMTDEKGKSKGFGFVCFSSSEEATKAVEMNSKMIGSKPLYVALHQRKDIRKQTLQAQFAQRGRMGIFPQGRGAIPYGVDPSMTFYPQPNMMYGMMPTGRGMAPRGGYPNPNFAAQNYMMMQGNARGSLKPTGRGMPSRGYPKNFPYGYPPMMMTPEQIQQQQMVAQQQPVQPTQQQTQQEFNEQYRRFGEQLYPLIAKIHPEEKLAAKITGMILDGSKIEELQKLLTNSEALKSKVAEAIEVLREHNQL